MSHRIRLALVGRARSRRPRGCRASRRRANAQARRHAARRHARGGLDLRSAQGRVGQRPHVPVPGLRHPRALRREAERVPGAGRVVGDAGPEDPRAQAQQAASSSTTARRSTPRPCGSTSLRAQDKTHSSITSELTGIEAGGGRRRPHRAPQLRPPTPPSSWPSPTAPGMMISPTAAQKLGISSGAPRSARAKYRMVAWQPGSEARLERFGDYYEPGRPYLDAIVFKIMPDADTRVSALRSGQVDFIMEVPAQDFEGLQGRARPARLRGPDARLLAHLHEHRQAAARQEGARARPMNWRLDRPSLLKTIIFGPRRGGQPRRSPPLLGHQSRRSSPSRTIRRAPRPSSPRRGCPTASPSTWCWSPRPSTCAARRPSRPSSAPSASRSTQADGARQGRAGVLSRQGDGGRQLSLDGPARSRPDRARACSTAPGFYNPGGLKVPRVEELMDQAKATYKQEERRPLLPADRRGRAAGGDRHRRSTSRLARGDEHERAGLPAEPPGQARVPRGLAAGQVRRRVGRFLRRRLLAVVPAGAPRHVDGVLADLAVARRSGGGAGRHGGRQRGEARRDPPAAGPRPPARRAVRDLARARRARRLRRVAAHRPARHRGDHRAAPITLGLALAGTAFGLAGRRSPRHRCRGRRRGGVIDTLASGLAAFGVAVPNFWLGSMLVLVLALQLRWLPATGYVSPFESPGGRRPPHAPAHADPRRLRGGGGEPAAPLVPRRGAPRRLRARRRAPRAWRGRAWWQARAAPRAHPGGHGGGPHHLAAGQQHGGGGVDLRAARARAAEPRVRAEPGLPDAPGRGARHRAGRHRGEPALGPRSTASSTPDPLWAETRRVGERLACDASRGAAWRWSARASSRC